MAMELIHSWFPCWNHNFERIVTPEGNDLSHLIGSTLWLLSSCCSFDWIEMFRGDRCFRFANRGVLVASPFVVSSGWWSSLPLWKILVNWDDSSQYMEKWKMFQTTNQGIFCFFWGVACRQQRNDVNHNTSKKGWTPQRGQPQNLPVDLWFPTNHPSILSVSWELKEVLNCSISWPRLSPED